MKPDDPRHGTVNGYTNLKCRCDACREAWRQEHWLYMSRPEQREKAAQRERDRYAAYKRGEYKPPRGTWNPKKDSA